MKRFAPIAFWSFLTLVVLGGMALRPTWNDSDYYIELVNMAAMGVKPHVDYPHIYTLLSTWIMIPLKVVLGSWFSPTSMSVLIGLFYLAVAWLVFSMLRHLKCPSIAAHAGAALTVFLGISSGHLQFTLEPWCVLFGTISLWCVICGSGNLLWAVMAGGCAAATFLCKQNGGIFLPAVFVVAWAYLPRDRRILFLLEFCFSVLITLTIYLVGTRLWLGDWSALPAFLGRVPYSRSMNIARGEAIGTLVKTVLWCWPVWLSALVSWRRQRGMTAAILFGCLLIIPAVVVSPGDHNRYYIAPFLGLLLGLGWQETKRFRICMLGAFGLYLAEVALRCVLYLQEPIQNVVDHGSVYPRDDLELVGALREVLKPSDRLLVVPEDDSVSVARFYVLADVVPATLDVRHQENLGWGTEFMFGDEVYKATSISNATAWAIHRDTKFHTSQEMAQKLGGHTVRATANWEILKRKVL